jgi:lipoprotein-releasing system permease protein
MHDGANQPAILQGILPSQEIKTSSLDSKLRYGHLTQLKAGQFGIILGQALANTLGVTVGDKVTVLTPQASMTPAGIFPRLKRFTVTDIFHVSGGFGFDRGFGFVHLKDAQTLLKLKNNVSGLHLNVKNPFEAPAFSDTLNLPDNMIVSDWTDQFGAFFHAVSLEKTMMFFILLLIVAVAVFNLVSSLVMVVNDKAADIAILRTFGATPRMIMHVFIVQGMIIGLFGVLLGVIGGVVLSLNVTELVNWVQAFFHVQFLSSDIYFIDYLPSEIIPMDIIKIVSAALGMSFIATIYPAWRASRTLPAEALRYE